ncbi:MAG: hypothetical protein KatS3mg112_0759 [Thermogutta sp.]|nr:MAG: hypothetical protein KatS3mg112_0759 [Thermogutta sp.]
MDKRYLLCITLTAWLPCRSPAAGKRLKSGAKPSDTLYVDETNFVGCPVHFAFAPNYRATTPGKESTDLYGYGV